MKGPGRSSDGQAGMGDEPLPLAFEAGVEGIVGKHARRGVDDAHPSEHDLVRKDDGCAGRSEGAQDIEQRPVPAGDFKNRPFGRQHLCECGQ